MEQQPSELEQLQQQVQQMGAQLQEAQTVINNLKIRAFDGEEKAKNADAFIQQIVTASGFKSGDANQLLAHIRDLANKSAVQPEPPEPRQPRAKK